MADVGCGGHVAKQTIAFLGLGTMGSGMAGNLVKAGFALPFGTARRQRVRPWWIKVPGR